MNSMTKEEAAAQLDGNEYCREGSVELWARMKVRGLVAVFGASDDLMEFRGAIHDEVGCYGGGTAYVTHDGLLQSECDCEDCPYFGRLLDDAATIEASWSPDGEDLSWAYITDIPHATFTIMEDGEPYCKGIVFALADVHQKEPDHG